MNIEVNSERSYLGKDIKAWCMSDTEDANWVYDNTIPNIEITAWKSNCEPYSKN